MIRLALPLALLATPALAAPAPTPNWSRGAAVAITVTNDGFSPARLPLRAGRHYVLTIRNVSDRTHNLSAPHFFSAARVAPADGHWVSDDKVDLKPGRSARLRIVAPRTPAYYEFRSTNLLDAAAGLKGAFVVR